MKVKNYRSKHSFKINNERLILRSYLLEHLANSLSGALPEAIERRLFGQITFPGKATTLIGMRRSGKTTFLYQIRKERINKGRPQECLPHINFEDERLAGTTVNDLAFLVEEYYRKFPAFRGKETVTWCFDEVQNVPGWERFIRRLLDTEKVEIFLSGSSASLLSREIATHLRGRAWEVIIFPFSFEEYLRYHGIKIPDRLDLISSPERSQLQASLRQYLVSGGFPEAQGLDQETRHRRLQS